MIDFSHDFLRKNCQNFEIQEIQPENQKFHGKVRLKHWDHFFIGQSLTPDTPLLRFHMKFARYLHISMVLLSSRPKKLLRSTIASWPLLVVAVVAVPIVCGADRPR